jgi:hypothetical protein
MSRRTKLIILAVFLVLLAIPTIYIALTWHPAFPLRFVVESIDPEPMKGSSYRHLHVRVENTGPVPVHFYGGFMYAIYGPVSNPENPSGGLSPQEDIAGAPWANMDEGLIMPAYGNLHIRGAIRADLVNLPEGGEFLVQCTWQTATHARVGRALAWAREHSPWWIGDSIPHDSLLEAVAPVEFQSRR